MATFLIIKLPSDQRLCDICDALFNSLVYSRGQLGTTFKSRHLSYVWLILKRDFCRPTTKLQEGNVFSHVCP